MHHHWTHRAAILLCWNHLEKESLPAARIFTDIMELNLSIILRKYICIQSKFLSRFLVCWIIFHQIIVQYYKFSTKIVFDLYALSSVLLFFFYYFFSYFWFIIFFLLGNGLWWNSKLNKKLKKIGSIRFPSTEVFFFLRNLLIDLHI